MNWSNVKLIFMREVRDQLRDRRTLFMIAVLPLLLYPMLGVSFSQVMQFMREQPTRAIVFGLPELPDLPELVENGQFAERWQTDPKRGRLVELKIVPVGEVGTDENLLEEARQALARGECEAILAFPPDFATQLARFREQLLSNRSGNNGSGQAQAAVPRPVIYCNSANEKSVLAYDRITSVLRAWGDAIGQQNLKESRLPPTAAQPVEFEREDVAKAAQRNAAMWSKILPFVLLIWALTGAFYPAIDLCAGEKERGTLETLLCSPAQRTEIVTGKLLTVMLFSTATSILNLLSMGLTGLLIVSHMPSSEGLTRFGMPPLASLLWLVVALPAVAALFSALCLALAAFARSTKEGQYYLMPLVLVAMPLVVLPMSPGVELTLGNSLIPLTGLVLLLKGLLEGNYIAVLPYAAPVIGVTLICCFLAVRWAVDQFNKEEVLFRESDRLDMGLWLKHLVRDRSDTPSVAEALFCGVIILVVSFFIGVSAAIPTTFPELAKTAVVSQLVVILTPALLMTVMLTRSPRQTLLLRKPILWTLPAAVLLAVSLQPVVKLLEVTVKQLYPMSQETKQAAEMIGRLLGDAPNFLTMVLLAAALPAICEELAFRGFILSGLRHFGHKWRAIVISSIFFGITHTMLQQTVIACLLGIVIGYLAVQTGSIFPGMLFHVTYNTLQLAAAQAADQPRFQHIFLWLGKDAYIYSWWVFGAGSVFALWLLLKFTGLSYQKTQEETLQEALDHQVVETSA
jgi:sodium transport system permease protein